MKVLADTSVWIEHFKKGVDELADLLNSNAVLTHPEILVEIACGTPPDRANTLNLMSKLERAPVATRQELLAFIERRELYGRGCGAIDLAILASALMADSVKLWTLDKRLHELAKEMGVAYDIPAT